MSTPNWDRLPTEIRECFDLLWPDAVMLNLASEQFFQLYGAENVDLLNYAAPGFFSVTQRVMWDDILLRLSRLTDPATVGGRENLSLARLVDNIPDKKLRKETEAKLRAILSKVKPLRARRNRRIAHADWPTVRKEESLPALSFRDADYLIRLVGELLNLVEDHYACPTTEWRPKVSGGVRALIGVLKRGRDAEQREREELTGAGGSQSKKRRGSGTSEDAGKGADKR